MLQFKLHITFAIAILATITHAGLSCVQNLYHIYLATQLELATAWNVS